MAEQVDVTIQNPEVNANFSEPVVNIELDQTGPQGPQGSPGEGVPAGGTANQFLMKDSGTDYDTSWQTILASHVSDFSEAVDDRVSGLIQNGTGLTWSYVDGSGTLTGNVSLSAFDTDDLAEGSTNLYSQWETTAGSTVNYINPITATDKLLIGQQAIIPEWEATFGSEAAAIFTNPTEGGISYFGNIAVGTSFLTGGLFLAGYVAGSVASPAAPTDAFIGGIVFASHDGNAFTINASGTYVLPGVFGRLSGTPSADTFNSDVIMGSYLFAGVSVKLRNAGQTAVVINDSSIDADFQVNWDSGTALFVEGSTGDTSIYGSAGAIINVDYSANQALFYSGSAANPGIAFSSNIDSGFRYQGPFFSPTYIMAVIDGTDRMRITEDSVRFRDGTATNTAIGFISSGTGLDQSEDGFFKQATNSIGISTDGTERARINADGQVLVSNGSASLPSLGFINDADTGLHYVTTNQFSLDAGGLSRMQVSSLEVTINPGKIASNDFRVHGDTVDNLLFADVSADALGFFNTTPVTQPANTVAINDVLVNLGLRSSGGNANFSTDVEIDSSSNGVILESPDTTRWRITVDNVGALTTTAI